MSRTRNYIEARLKDLASKWMKGCTSVEELKDMVILEQLVNTLPDDVRVFVKESKPKSSAEAGRLADDYIIARKENAAGIEKEEDKKVPDRRLPPRCGKCRKLGHIWRGIVGRHNPGLNEKKRKRKFRGSREKTSKILSVIIAIRRDITRLIVQAMLCSAGRSHHGKG